MPCPLHVPWAHHNDICWISQPINLLFMNFSSSFISFFSASDNLFDNGGFLRARDQEKDLQRYDTTDKSLTYTSYLVIWSQASCLRHPVLYRSCIPSYLYANAYQFYVAVYASMPLGVIGPDTQNVSNRNPSCVQSRSDIIHHSLRGPSCDKSIHSSKASSP